jgi:tetratricopeptide (TPR) repeat protein
MINKQVIFFILLTFSSISFTSSKNNDTLRSHKRGATDIQKLESIMTAIKTNINDSLDKALIYCEQASELAKELEDKHREALSAFYCGKIYRKLEKFDQALKMQQKAIDLFKALKNDSLRARCLIEFGLNHFLIPNVEKAIVSFNRALELYTTKNDSLGISTAYYNLGRCHRKSGDMDAALNYSLQSLDYQQENNHNAYNTISIIYATMGDIEKAFEYQTKALRIREKLGLKEDKIGSLNNLGIMSARMGKYEQALGYLKQAADDSKRIGKNLDYCRAMNNIGFIYDEFLGNLEQALHYYQKSLRVSSEIHEYLEKANTMINIGDVLSKLEQYDRSIINFNSGIELSKKNTCKRDYKKWIPGINIAL